MKCKSCGHQATQSEAISGASICSRCGGHYDAAEVGHTLNAIPSFGASRSEQNHPDARPVVVVDINMDFSSMVIFMLKWSVASIPALAILIALGTGAIFLIRGLLS